MEQKQTSVSILSIIQTEIKAHKSQFNSFGKYNYRKAEDILEALKPLLAKHNSAIILTDEVVCVHDRVYVKSTATLKTPVGEESSVGYARESEKKSGMDEAQITGACSSYARKYALGGLLALDDTQDADATNTHEKETPKKEEPTPTTKDEGSQSSSSDGGKKKANKTEITKMKQFVASLKSVDEAKAYLNQQTQDYAFTEDQFTELKEHLTNTFQ